MSTLEILLRRKFCEPIHGRLKGSGMLAYSRRLEKTQYLPEEQLRDIQLRRFRELMRFLWESNDFYLQRFKKAGVAPDDFREPGDIRQIPILTKAEIRANTQRMISRSFDIKHLQKAKTGGSTGKALDLFFTEECSELRNACARRHDRWTGWEPGEPIAACWGNPHLPKSIKDRVKHWALQPMIYLDTMSVNESSVAAFVQQWKRVKATLLYGHAHSLYLLSQLLGAMNIDHPKPKGILSTSMMLMPSERKVIESKFGVRVTDRYGCEEVSLIGCECERHEGMHLNIEHLLVEFVKEDGEHAAPGEPGHVVVTDLMNRAMPLIRYNVEDVGVPSTRKCPCGRGLPLMEHVVGRVADFLIKKNGNKVAGVSLIENTLTRFEGLDQMQIVQSALDNFQLNIVPGKGYCNEIGDRLKDYFQTIFGDNLRVNVTLLKEILPEKSGKYRFSINMVENALPNG